MLQLPLSFPGHPQPARLTFRVVIVSPSSTLQMARRSFPALAGGTNEIKALSAPRGSCGQHWLSSKGGCWHSSHQSQLRALEPRSCVSTLTECASCWQSSAGHNVNMTASCLCSAPPSNKCTHLAIPPVHYVASFFLPSFTQHNAWIHLLQFYALRKLGGSACL